MVCKIAILEILIITGLKSDAKLSVEDKTWTRGPWTTPILDRVHGPPVMDLVHGHFLFKRELKVDMINKRYGRLQPTKLAQK